jgi:hypothetical protein
MILTTNSKVPEKKITIENNKLIRINVKPDEGKKKKKKKGKK